MCVNTVPKRNDIGSDRREAVVAAHQSGKAYKVISKQSGVQHFTVKKITHKRKTFTSATSLDRSNDQRNCRRNPRATFQTLKASVSFLKVKGS